VNLIDFSLLLIVASVALLEVLVIEYRAKEECEFLTKWCLGIQLELLLDELVKLVE
jgi:hypothetical protein